MLDFNILSFVCEFYGQPILLDILNETGPTDGYGKEKKTKNLTPICVPLFLCVCVCVFFGSLFGVTFCQFH